MSLPDAIASAACACRAPYRRATGCGGFTLVEMLAVLAIMVAMMSLLGLGIVQMTAQSARKSAVNLVMNTFEQARVAALRQGVSAYVGIADGDSRFAEDQRYRAFVVFRDRTESDLPPSSDPAAPPYVVLSKWKKLPRGISFRSSPGTILSSTQTRTLTLPGGANVDVPALEFNQTGMITEPSTGEITLYLYEGYYDGTRDVLTMNGSSDLFEGFSSARFTGRIRHEVSAL